MEKDLTKFIELAGSSNKFGTTVISKNALEKIVSLASRNVDGVIDLSNNFTDFIDEIFTNHSGGVEVSHDEKGYLVIDVSIIINSNSSIPTVAKNVQINVKREVETMTNLEVSTVNISVDGVRTEEAKNGDNKFSNSKEKTSPKKYSNKNNSRKNSYKKNFNDKKKSPVSNSEVNNNDKKNELEANNKKNYSIKTRTKNNSEDIKIVNNNDSSK